MSLDPAAPPWSFLGRSLLRARRMFSTWRDHLAGVEQSGDWKGSEGGSEAAAAAAATAAAAAPTGGAAGLGAAAVRGPGTLAAGEEDVGAARAGTAGGEVGDLPVAAWVFLLVVVLPAGLEPGEGMEFCGSGADDATGLLRPSWGLRGGERSSRSRAAGAGAGGERGDDRGGVAASVWGRGVEAVRVVLGGEVAATGSAGLDVSEESELGRPRPLRRLSPCFGLLLRSLSTVLLMMGPRSCHCRAGRAGALLVGVRWGDGGGAS